MEKSILLVCDYHPNAGECATALPVITFDSGHFGNFPGGDPDQDSRAFAKHCD